MKKWMITRSIKDPKIEEVEVAGEEMCVILCDPGLMDDGFTSFYVISRKLRGGEGSGAEGYGGSDIAI